jgi:ABC-type dipeptide/oligopeptide/nickel transport system permease component
MGGGPAGSAPPNNLVLAIISLLCCWPIGIPAVIFAAQVNSKWAAGDQAGAVEASAKARKFAIIALVLGIVVSIIYFFVIVGGGMASNTGV